MVGDRLDIFPQKNLQVFDKTQNVVYEHISTNTIPLATKLDRVVNHSEAFCYSYMTLQSRDLARSPDELKTTPLPQWLKPKNLAVC